jgi:hypothetical protein
MKILNTMRIKYERIDYLIPIAYLILTVIFTYPVASKYLVQVAMLISLYGASGGLKRHY